jgi:two-component system response regulator NreC
MPEETTLDPAARELRVLLVDDHAVLRAGLRLVLGAVDGISVVAEAGTVRDALEQAEVKRPDVVVLDVDLPDGSGIDMLPELLRVTRSAARVLILSMHDEPRYVEEAFAAGAHGYLLKDAAETELVAAINVLAAGEEYVYPPLGARMLQAARRGPDDPLTDREREIARLLALGHTNQEIAGQLFLSIRTIETHRSHLMGKLRLKTRAELTAWALERGLLASD